MMTPEAYQQMLDMGNENDQLDRQMAMSAKLRSPLQTRGAPGGYQIAPSWLELAGNLAGQYGDIKGTKKRGVNTGSQNSMLLKALLGQQMMNPADQQMMNPAVQQMNPAGMQYPRQPDEA